MKILGIMRLARMVSLQFARGASEGPQELLLLETSPKPFPES